jgi:rubrerythrin
MPLGGSMEFQQSKTYSNLQSAFDWELNVSTQYSLYGDRARLDGYIQIGKIFDTISFNEREHARIWQRQLNNGQLPDTSENLAHCTQLETYSGNEMYREYARVAREEGFDDIASLFNGVANIELNHSQVFQELYGDIERNEVSCKPQETLWICMECGNILSGTCAPEVCPVCGFPQGYYKVYTNDISSYD